MPSTKETGPGLFLLYIPWWSFPDLMVSKLVMYVYIYIFIFFADSFVYVRGSSSFFLGAGVGVGVSLLSFTEFVGALFLQNRAHATSVLQYRLLGTTTGDFVLFLRVRVCLPVCFSGFYNSFVFVFVFLRGSLTDVG